MADDDKGQGDAQGQGDGKAQGEGTVTRAEFGSLESKVDRILEALKPGDAGKGDGKGDEPPAGKSVAEQVREGIDQLEAERKQREKDAAADAERAEYKAKVDKLTEVKPAEPLSVVGKMRRRLYGTEPDGSAVPPRRRRTDAAS